MGDYNDFDSPVTIDTSSLSGPENEFVHLDDIDEPDCTKLYHIYIYEDEERSDEVAELIADLREEFILARGVVWPSWLRDHMPLDTDVLLALEWILAYGEDLTPDRLASVQNELCQEENT